MNVMHACSNAKQFGAAVVLLMSSIAVQAAPVVYEDVSFFCGTAEQAEQFTINNAGTYSATLTDFKFPNSFTANFGLMVSTSVAEMGQTLGPGSFTFEATPGTYWASVFGVPGGSLNMGLFGVRVEMLASAVPSPVPLPGGLVLLASALVAYVGFGRGGARVFPRNDEPEPNGVPA